jgi:hypothetical protein
VQTVQDASGALVDDGVVERAMVEGVSFGATLIPYDFILAVLGLALAGGFYFLLYRSVPMTLVDDGIRLARRGADMTSATELDDELVEMFARMVEKYKAAQADNPTPSQ